MEYTFDIMNLNLDFECCLRSVVNYFSFGMLEIYSVCLDREYNFHELRFYFTKFSHFLLGNWRKRYSYFL